ncbi:MAG TPA: FAD-dependent oxidoreductase [Thermogutta sp.]|nr:FAD-dependent oxidoreductase [Thermogutta sp.]
MKNSRRSFLRCSMASPLFIASLGQRGTSAATTSLSEANSGSSVLAEPARQIPVAGESDVIVCGAGPAGVAAAIAAARCGATVRLLEVHGCLGGIWTAGLLSWILDAGNKKGIIQEIIARLRMRDAVATYPEGASNAVGYRPEIMKWVLEEMIQEAGVCVQLFTRVCAAHVDDTKRLQAVITESKSGRQGWRAKVFVDATGDGDLAAFAGCRFDYGDEEGGPVQPMSMLAMLVGLDPEAVKPFVRGLAEPDGERNPKGRLLEEIRRGGHDPSYHAPTMFYLGHGLFCLMANHEYRVSALDAAEITAATFRSRAEVHRIVEALRSLGGPWKEIQIVARNEQIGVREGRRPYGLYRLTAEDLKNGTRHEDAVCTVTFPVDIHSPDPEKNKGIVARGFRSQPYDIPYRALVAADVRGLLFAGRCISGDFVAHSSYRVTGNAAAMGEAAGVAAALAAAHHCDPKDVPWSEIASQLERLRSQAG